MHQHEAGRRGERVALKYLRQRGLRLITKNFRCRLGEVDLIMRDTSAIQSNILVFVEVRYRARLDYGGASASVTPTKQRKLINTAEMFRKQQSGYATWPCRFDVVAISGTLGNMQCCWLAGAFD
ncbi:MAG: YraN family protein [Pseudomonadales bacterium]|nr:MAG: YraN family protein [Pseudomonadales bacterium]